MEQAEDIDPGTEFADIGDAADQVVQEMGGGQVRDAATSVTEAQRRIRMALYFEAFLAEPVFTNRTPEAEFVEGELRQYAQQRMEVLLGMRSEVAPPEAQFADDEVKALKLLAHRMIDGASKPAPQQDPKPSVRRISVPGEKPAPQAKPEVRKEPEVVPKVRRRAARSVPAPAAPAAPAQQPARPAAPAPVQEPKAPPPPPVAKNRGMVVKTAETAAVGERFAENGQWYMWVVNDLGHRYKKSVGGAVFNPAAMPLPQGQAWEFATAQLAARQVQANLRAMEREMDDPKTDAQTERMIR